MSSSYDVVVALPPDGTLIRDLTLSFVIGLVATASRLGRGCRATCNHESVYLSFERESEWEMVTGTLLGSTRSLLELKRETLRCPQLHVNDYNNVFKALLGADVSKTSSYLDAFIAMTLNKKHASSLMDPKTGPKHLSLLTSSRSTMTLGAEEGGMRGYALIQPLKVETYEYGSSFHKPYRLDFKVRTTVPWLLVFGVGFAFSYAGMTPEGLFFITPDEGALADLNTVRISTAVNLAASLLRAPADPTLPYLTYVALTIPELVNRSRSTEVLSVALEKGVVDYLLSDEESEALAKEPMPRIKLHKMSTTIRAYTALLRESVDASTLVRYAFTLDKVSGGSDCRKYLVNRVVKPALGGREPKYLSLVAHLYEAVHGAKSPYFSTYYIARELDPVPPSYVRGMIRALEELR